MGISTQHLSEIAQKSINQGAVRAVAVANAGLVAQQNIVNGTNSLVQAALSDNSTITLTETKVSFQESPLEVRTGSISHGQLSVSPPTSSNLPDIQRTGLPTVEGLPSAEDPTRLEPQLSIAAPTVQGDLILPGGVVTLENVSLEAASIHAEPQAPVFTVPVLSSSASPGSSPTPLDTAAQHYVQVVLVGSAQSIVTTALQDSPPGP